MKKTKRKKEGRVYYIRQGVLGKVIGTKGSKGIVRFFWCVEKEKVANKKERKETRSSTDSLFLYIVFNFLFYLQTLSLLFSICLILSKKSVFFHFF